MDKKANDQTKSLLPKILYLGGDRSYWSSLSDKFTLEYESPKFEFINLNKETPEEIQKLIIEVRDLRPKIVFVDFSQYTPHMLHVVRVLSRMNRIHKPVVMGLVDLNQAVDVSRKVLVSGATCVHIKSVELSSVVYNSMSFAFPDKVKPHGYATAKLRDSIQARLPCKVGLISQDGIRIESYLPFSIGESYPLHTHWSNKNILKTPMAECASSTDEDLYYNYKYAQEFAFHFVEEIDDHDMSEEEYEAAENERETLIEESADLLYSWIENNKELSKPKPLKTLVVDKNLTFYSADAITDEYPFVLRCQPYLKNPLKDLTRVQPGLIAFHLEDVSEEEIKANEDIAFSFNDISSLKFMVKTIRSISGFHPYVIVFNSKNLDSDNLKKALNYDHIIAYPEVMTTELVLKMASMLESKLVESVVEYDEGTLFLQKDHPATYAELEVEMTILALSENDIYFNSPIDFPNKAILRVETPVNMYISICEPPNGSDINSNYYAVIHTIGEVQRSELRKFINTVFFRKHEEKKNREKEEFEALKQKAIAEKEKAERELKEREIAEQKALEENSEGNNKQEVDK